MVWQFLQKLNIDLAYNPTIPFLGIYVPKSNENLGPHKDLHKKVMVVAALVTAAPKWKQPKCLSPGEWISRMWYMHMMGYATEQQKGMNA